MSTRTVVIAIGCIYLGSGVAAAIWAAAWHFLHGPRCRGNRTALAKTRAQLDLARSREMKALEKAREAWRLVDEAREDARRARNQLGYVTGLNRIHDMDAPFLAGDPIPDLPADLLSDAEIEQRWHRVVETFNQRSDQEGRDS